jgi:phosphopantetheinyl transferase (holo-ACP synthase)
MIIGIGNDIVDIRRFLPTLKRRNQIDVRNVLHLMQSDLLPKKLARKHLALVLIEVCFGKIWAL